MCPAGSAMHVDDHRIFFRGIEIARIDQPTLNFVAAVFPANALGFAPSWLDALVAVRGLLPLANWAGPNLRRDAERIANHGGSSSVRGDGEVWKPRAVGNHFAAAPERFDTGVGRVEHADRGIRFDNFSEKNF